MRVGFFLWILLFAVLMQAQVVEHFSYQDFEESTIWRGDKHFFKLSSSSAVPANMRPALQLKGDTTKNMAYLSTYIDLENVDSIIWEFWAKLSFTPSANNYARIYLVSDRENFSEATEAYYISLGEKERTVALYKQNQEKVSTLIEGIKLNKTTNVVRCKIKQGRSQNWAFWLDTLGNDDYCLQGSCVDVANISEFYAGIYCHFTKSNAEKMYFDDFMIQKLTADTISPQVDSLVMELPNKLHLYFSEEINSIIASNSSNYIVNNGVGEPIEAIVGRKMITLEFFPFKSGVKYFLTINNIEDLYGNKISETKLPFFFYNLQFNDIVINEILSHPRSGGAKFVEIYNRTPFDIPLKNLRLATIDKTSGALKTLTKISDISIIKSHDYTIVTTSKEAIETHYMVHYPEKIIELKSLPSYPNAEGTVILTLADSTIIDRFDYSEKMHFNLLKEKTGVSLERRNFDRPTNEVENWQSAAESAGWATPTYQNSQHSDHPNTSNIFDIQPEIFSPNNDGVDDLLNIYYHLDKDGYTANMTIYDAQGRLVRKLQSNTLLGLEGNFVWNGLNDQGRKVSIGYYIIFIEFFDLQGNVKHFKKVVVLAG